LVEADAAVFVYVQGLVTGVFVAIVVQFVRRRSGMVCRVRRKFGVVLMTTVTELLVVLEMLVNLGASGVGILPASPLNVTAPVWASALPSIVELAFIVMDAYAIMVPLKFEDVPRVAELPTCQKMFLACAPPIKMTSRPTPTVSVLAIWKTQTSFGPPLRVRSTEVMSYAPDGDT
jgi:hypothetical protein